MSERPGPHEEAALPQAATDSDRSRPATTTPPNGEPVRGIYVSAYTVLSRRIQELVSLIENTELNAMVVDVNSGIRLTSLHQGRDGAFLPSDTAAAARFRESVRELKRRHIHLIARIVVFKDSQLAEAKPQWAIRRKDGAIWRDRSGKAWLDPYRQASWQYAIDTAVQVAQLGFDEVQFDYVRFPENERKVDREVRYAPHGDLDKSAAIGRFLQAATHRVHAQGSKVSADVFGLVGSSADDMGIGQSWRQIATRVDYISPMVYPSHYAPGMWGIAAPDLTPIPVVARTLTDAARRNERLRAEGLKPARIRPWLQGFTATWVKPHRAYGPVEIAEQIRATRAAGFSSYLIWNSSCRYPAFSTR